MNRFKILFLDIDGTIVTSNDTIQGTTKEAISIVQEKGINVVLATGRPLHEISHIIRELNVQSLIGYNGAYAIHNGRDIFKEPLNRSIIKDFLEIAHDYQHEMVMYTNEKNAWNTMESPRAIQFMNKFHLKTNDLYSPSDINNILGISIIIDGEDEYKLYENNKGIRLSEVNIDVEGINHCYDVIRETVNKGMAVKIMLEHLGIERESAIAFGDGMNDKEMLSIVGESFAMGNADPELFQYAKHKTTDVNNSGIYNGLKSLGLLK